jgi:FMN reductase (NADPH)
MRSADASVEVALNGTRSWPSDILTVLEGRTSCRNFRSDPVDDDLVARVIGAARRAPTSSNLQAYSLVVVREAATRRSLADLVGKQAHVSAAPVFIAFCADLWRLERACALTGNSFAADTLEMGLVAVLDATLVGMCASLAAESLGLGTVMIGGLRNKPVEVAALLDLPPKVFGVFGLCLGWPSAVGQPKPRLPAAAVVHDEVYDVADVDASLAAYDATHNSGAGGSWLARVAREAAEPRRDDLRHALAALGLRFD